MNPFMFMCMGWLCFIPMASLSFLACQAKSSSDDFKPGTMCLIDENGDHQRYEVGEYDREIL